MYILNTPSSICVCLWKKKNYVKSVSSTRKGLRVFLPRAKHFAHKSRAFVSQPKAHVKPPICLPNGIYAIKYTHIHPKIIMRPKKSPLSPSSHWLQHLCLKKHKRLKATTTSNRPDDNAIKVLFHSIYIYYVMCAHMCVRMCFVYKTHTTRD